VVSYDRVETGAEVEAGIGQGDDEGWIKGRNGSCINAKSSVNLSTALDVQAKGPRGLRKSDVEGRACERYEVAIDSNGAGVVNIQFLSWRHGQTTSGD